MSKDSLTTSPKKSLNKSLNSMVRLRVWDSIQLIRRRNFTPLSASRSQMRPLPPKKSSTTRNGMEELWLSITMRSKNTVNFKTRLLKTSVASSSSAKLTPRALSGLTWPIRKSSSTTLSFLSRACQCSCSRREEFKVVKVDSLWVDNREDPIRVANSHTVRTKELAEDKEAEIWWIQWDSQEWEVCNHKWETCHKTTFTWCRIFRKKWLHLSRCNNSSWQWIKDSSWLATKSYLPLLPRTPTTRTKSELFSTNLSTSLLDHKLQRLPVCLSTFQLRIFNSSCKTTIYSRLVSAKLMSSLLNSQASEHLLPEFIDISLLSSIVII